MILWESLAPKLVIDAIKSLREEAEEKRTKEYERRENVFGGETNAYLIRHIAESDAAWGERTRRFTDCGIMPRVANTFKAALAGHPIKREITDASEDLQAKIATIMDDSRMDSKQRMIAHDQIVAGDGFDLWAFSDRLGKLIRHSVDPGNIFVEFDEDDPMREWCVIERRIDPNNADRKPWYWVWTAEAKTLVDEDGNPLDQGGGKFGWQKNPYGVIPYTHWRALPLSESYWGMSPVRATTEIHLYCNNLRSQLDRLLLYQAHSTLAISDDLWEAGKTSESNAIVLSKDGRAQYLVPGADIPAMETSYERARREAFEVAGIPMNIVAGGEVPSGYALVVESRSMAEVAEDLAVESHAAEVESFTKMCKIGAVHGLGLPEDPEVNIDLQIEVLPFDKDGAQQRDLLDVQSGLMSKRDYVRRYRFQEDTPDEVVDKYLAEIKAEQTAAREASFADRGFGEPEDEA